MFRIGMLRDAIARAREDGHDLTDEASAIEWLGHAPRLVQGSLRNFKVTYPEDFALAEAILRSELTSTDARHLNRDRSRDRIEGLTHGFQNRTRLRRSPARAGRPLIIGGVTIPYERGLLGHSDADVLLHAITDALFGAAALGDIGRHFPDTDERIRRRRQPRACCARRSGAYRQAGFAIANVDSTVIAQAPKLAPHIEAMRANIAEDLDLPLDRVNVKAKTNEKLGYLGRGRGHRSAGRRCCCAGRERSERLTTRPT